ncbi:MAG: TonB-dependent receptor [Bacteroidales bacterium]
MTQRLTLLFFLLGSLQCFSQQQIRGTVTNNNGVPLPGANIYFEGSFDGSVSDTAGRFTLVASAPESYRIHCSYLGFEDQILIIDSLHFPKELKIVLQEKVNALNDVVISAGTFGAADSKKAVILKPYDILTTASAIGDIYGALHTLPGNSIVGEDGGLFVRGGEGYESKTFIDGLLVQKPYTSRNPDLPARGRFSPTLFSGTMFSSGGFSAEYGQALSSALILMTSGTLEKTKSSISVMPFGGGASVDQLWNSGSVSVSANYYNMKPYYAIQKQDIDWIREPQNGSGTLIFSQKTAKAGQLHLFMAGNLSSSKLRIPQPGMSTGGTAYSLANRDGYLNMVYSSPLTEKWSLRSGISITGDVEEIHPGEDKVRIGEKGYQLKNTFLCQTSENFIFKTGLQFDGISYVLNYYSAMSGTSTEPSFNTGMLSGFAEGEWKIAHRYSIRGGGRLEGTGSNSEILFSPRFSAAMKTSTYGQVSAAWGVFRQLPETNLLLVNPDLNNMQAVHYILNYQWIKGGRTFRTELYYKDYSRLVRYDSLYDPNPLDYHPDGFGYARGVELFWRDKETWQNIDYWVSYSWIDTKRKYRDYPLAVTPPWFPEHSLAAVYKQFIPDLMTQVSLSWTGSTGRPYEDPNTAGFMNGRTRAFSELNISINYIIMKKKFLAVIHSNVSNVLGQEHIYGYRYASVPDSDGHYASMAVRPASKRFILIGLFISFNPNQ